MTLGLPKTSHQLRWMLARRLGSAALVIGFAAGGASYLIETHRAEQAAFEHAADGVRHFESSAIQVAAGSAATEEHGALNRLLDRSRFVGIRVFGQDQALTYETWADVPPTIIDAVRSGQHQHRWPGRGEVHRNWITVDGERLIQIVLPLVGKDGNLAGYLEGVGRLDQESLQAQRDQVRNGALTAVIAVLLTALLLYPLLLAMLRQAVGLSSCLLDSNLSLMRSLGNAIAKRDSDTDDHNYRVTCYAVALAEAMELPKQDISALIAGAFLHDVGKIGIPDSILLKAGKLTDEEFEVMKTHVLLGIEIVEDNPWLTGAAMTIRYHHERFDGTGYPEGLRGDSIPLNARLFAVVDVFDALTSERPYKKPLGLNEALAIIERESGRHFDPAIVAVFQSLAPVLYAQTSQADSIELHRRMHETLARYFMATPMRS